MYYATLCAIAKNEEPFIVEWVNHHLLLGFEHIFLYDNSDGLPLAPLLAGYVDEGLVTVTPWPLTEHPQLSAYATALRDHGPKSVWMAFIDIDEFLVPKSCDDIRDYLEPFANFGGFAAHWKMFGSGGHKKRPPGGVIGNYTTMIEDFVLVKSIVRTDRVSHPLSPHHFAYKDNWFCVNEDRVPVSSSISYHTSKTIQVNHYYYKSFEDFTNKMNRGRACAPNSLTTKRDPKEYEVFARQAITGGPTDTTLVELAGRLGVKAETMDAGKIAATVLADCKTSLDGYLERVAADIAHKGCTEALRTMRRCLRYHDEPVTWLAAAKLCLADGKTDQALHFLQKLLTDIQSPLRNDAFRCLVDYYAKLGDDLTAGRLLQSISK